MTKRSLILALFCLAFFTTKAQNNLEKEGEIILTESDLTRIVSKIIAIKKRMLKQNQFMESNKNKVTSHLITDNINEFEINRLKQQIESLKGQQTNSPKNANNLYTFDESLYLKRDLDNLEIRFEQLQKALKENENKKTDYIIVDNTPANNAPTNTSPKLNLEVENAQKLKFQLDSLYKLVEKYGNFKDSISGNDYSLDFINIEKKITDLKTELNKKDTSATDYNLLNKRYKNYLKQFLFNNNSKSLDDASNLTVREIASILNENENIDILVKGFASNKGNPIYNQNLSMQRTEAIKTALISNGIHPTRILTVYYGIDYQAATDALARRVDVTFIIRK